MSATNIDHYLTRYAESSAAFYAAKIDSKYAHCIVIPMFDEDIACLASVLRHHSASDALVIAVVNAPDNASDRALSRTRELLTAVALSTTLDVLTVDCVSPGLSLSSRQGVGLARKIGTDIALQLYAQNKISNPWLYQTDADAELPEDYFSTQLPSSGAVVFGHRHHSDNARLAQAAKLYDLHMRCYIEGLQHAGSTYAYPTLGSTIAVHANAYAAVRGYPKKNAAEDFYLLNKVAKVAPVTFLPTPELRLQARRSQRVPFGTGPALDKIYNGLQHDPSGGFYQSYHPQSFELLKDTLRYLDEFAHHQASAPPMIGDLLTAIGFDKVSAVIINKYSAPSRRQTVLREWFDAGKTLRFIHQARRYYPDQPLLDSSTGV
jgi:hypothetical protein